VLPLVAEWRDKKQEYFLCITLNGAGEVIERRTVTVGILNQSLVHPRRSLPRRSRPCRSVILSTTTPREPWTLPPRISASPGSSSRQARSSHPVLDHIIVTKKGYVSLKELGHL
jgi:DNA repair protein RadC